MAGRTRRGRTGTPVSVSTNRSLQASSFHRKGDDAPQQVGNDRVWQAECYRHYKICGEARYSANYFGNAMSKCTLNVKETTEGSTQIVTTGPAAVALAEVFSGRVSESQMLHAIGVHLTVSGECYVIGRDVKNAAGQPTRLWQVYSPIQVTTVGKSYGLQIEGQPVLTLGATDDVIRIWRPLPDSPEFADSPFRALLPVLSEIETVTLHIYSQLTSRLAGSGILFLSEDMSFPPPPSIEGVEREFANSADAFMATLYEHMRAAKNNPGSADAQVPIVVQVPADQVDKSELVHFWSPLDEHAMPLRQDAIHRFALGMDLPPEMTEGMSSNGGTGGGTSNGVSHWGAWQIEESAIKIHIEPMLALVATAFTVDYIRIVVDKTTQFVSFDTSDLRLRPDRSKESIELYNLGLLKAEVVIRENGFDVSDMPNEKEQALWLLRKIASGSNTPEQVAAAAAQLGVDIPAGEPEEQTNEARPDPSLEEHPTRPRTPETASAVVLAVANVMVLRALEKAGNRLRSQGCKPPGVPAHRVHCYAKVQNPNAPALLADAFSCADMALEGIADQERVVPVLQAYTAALIKDGTEHSSERLGKWLALADEKVSA